VPDEDESVTNAVANNMHYHVRNADKLLAAYRSTVTDSPQAEAMRSRARAWAKTIAAGFGAHREDSAPMAVDDITIVTGVDQRRSQLYLEHPKLADRGQIESTNAQLIASYCVSLTMARSVGGSARAFATHFLGSSPERANFL
jgi:hypothetical protein